MKIIIAGSRNIVEYSLIEQTIKDSGFYISEIISGGANGVDTLGELYAKNNNIPISIFKADWDLYGKSAGMKRNLRMLNHCDGLIAIWDGKSRGTQHMIEKTILADKKYFWYNISTNKYYTAAIDNKFFTC